ncbi:hypothetical protein [Thetidibacter halocola]|uniref:Uncharacterized protein n=1 Tax=Thetidibacter halocola TaxID=2827239 RepID=A0A8J7WFH8_9RHOB|nr:hypothetical protein [Thetidibacter halocola]MBS0124108.1 hypothetical protein [Thetidibacter halocola]
MASLSISKAGIVARFAVSRQRVRAAFAGPANPDLLLIRLQSAAEIAKSRLARS